MDETTGISTNRVEYASRMGDGLVANVPGGLIDKDKEASCTVGRTTPALRAVTWQITVAPKETVLEAFNNVKETISDEVCCVPHWMVEVLSATVALITTGKSNDCATTKRNAPGVGGKLAENVN